MSYYRGWISSCIDVEILAKKLHLIKHFQKKSYDRIDDICRPHLSFTHTTYVILAQA